MDLLKKRKEEIEAMNSNLEDARRESTKSKIISDDGRSELGGRIFYRIRIVFEIVRFVIADGAIKKRKLKFIGKN